VNELLKVSEPVNDTNSTCGDVLDAIRFQIVNEDDNYMRRYTRQATDLISPSTLYKNIVCFIKEENIDFINIINNIKNGNQSVPNDMVKTLIKVLEVITKDEVINSDIEYITLKMLTFKDKYYFYTQNDMDNYIPVSDREELYKFLNKDINLINNIGKVIARLGYENTIILLLQLSNYQR